MREEAANREVVEINLAFMKEAIERIEETGKDTNEKVLEMDKRLMSVELMLKQKDTLDKNKDDKLEALDSRIQALDSRTAILKFIQENPRVLIIAISALVLFCNKDFYNFLKNLL